MPAAELAVLVLQTTLMILFWLSVYLYVLMALTLILKSLRACHYPTVLLVGFGTAHLMLVSCLAPMELSTATLLVPVNYHIPSTARPSNLYGTQAL